MLNLHSPVAETSGGGLHHEPTCQRTSTTTHYKLITHSAESMSTLIIRRRARATCNYGRKFHAVATNQHHLMRAPCVIRQTTTTETWPPSYSHRTIVTAIILTFNYLSASNSSRVNSAYIVSSILSLVYCQYFMFHCCFHTLFSSLVSMMPYVHHYLVTSNSMSKICTISQTTPIKVCMSLFNFCSFQLIVYGEIFNRPTSMTATGKSLFYW